MSLLLDYEVVRIDVEMRAPLGPAALLTNVV